MRATQVLQSQLRGISMFFHEIADDLTDEEWTARAVPGTNLLGYTLWHMPRTQDWAVHTAIRGVAEVVNDGRWPGLGGPQDRGIGICIALAEADEIARSVARAEVIAYADAVHRAVCDWLGTVGDDELDIIPEVAAHLAPYGAYRASAFQAEVAGMLAHPVAEWIIFPCVEHLRDHLSEANLLKMVLRGVRRLET